MISYSDHVQFSPIKIVMPKDNLSKQPTVRFRNQGVPKYLLATAVLFNLVMFPAAKLSVHICEENL